MEMKLWSPQKKSIPFFVFPLIGAALILSITGYGIFMETKVFAENTKGPLEDKPLRDSQVKLLNLAFNAASSIPVSPHITDRSRAQEKVVDACLELGQPKQAMMFIEKIENWRKGMCYANLAYYCARQGDIDSMQYFSDIAEPIAKDAEDWRRDRIRIKIAQAHTWLGQTQKARQFASNVVASESGKVEYVQAMLCDEESFEDQVKTLDSYIAKGDFDIVKHALEAYVQLFDRFYKDTEKRAVIEDKITASWDTIPVNIRIDWLEKLAEFALENSDREKALKLINQAQNFIDKYQWKLEHRFPLMAKIIKLRYRAGDRKKSRSDADAALALYNEQGMKIVNIWRAGALRPLAEAYQMMGDKESALAVYKKSVQEGIANPNSRPRAEDLSAACCSMILSNCEPDAELWEQMLQIYGGLGQPW